MKIPESLQNTCLECSNLQQEHRKAWQYTPEGIAVYQDIFLCTERDKGLS